MNTLLHHEQVPVLPGSGLLNSAEEAGELADGIGYPVLLKVGLLGSTSDHSQAGQSSQCLLSVAMHKCSAARTGDGGNSDQCCIGYWRRRWHWHLHLRLPRRGRQPVCGCRAPGPGQLWRLRWAMECRANGMHPQQMIQLHAVLSSATIASRMLLRLPHAGHSSS